jgi:hypothetical protein
MTYEFDMSVVLPTAHMRRVSGARCGHNATAANSADNNDEERSKRAFTS